MIAGTAKAFALPLETVLYDLSYVNVVMYGATLPSYGAGKADRERKRKEAGETIRADIPENRERVRAMIRSFE